jgi:hypothetical protein
MSIQDWGAIGELLSAAAIFVTLIYLATQIKYARLTAMDINRTNRVVGIRDLNGVIAINADARTAWNKTIGPEYRRLHTDIAESLNLSFNEASIVISQGANWGYTHWAQYRSLKSSEDEEELKNIVKVWYSENPMSTLLSHDNFRAFFEADFVSWLDEIVAGGD